jgi:CubicO group peptidase (beta-lactamase class C family)
MPFLRFRRTHIVACLAVIAAAVPSIGLAQSPGQQAQSSTQQAQPLTPQVVKFLDAELEALIARGKIPGAVITVVEDGKVTLKGYGYSAIARKIPMDPERTLVRAGSVTKSFAALALWRLVDQRRVSIDADANTYLKHVRIPDTYPNPVRVRDLMTHRARFDADLAGFEPPRNGDVFVPPSTLQPSMVRMGRAADVTEYDNVAWTLVGQIVADLNGKPLDKVLQEQIFGPLGMRNSMLGIPPARAGEVAGCYTLDTPKLTPCTSQVLREPHRGAGDLTTTAADMGRYLTMLLAQGGYSGGRIISPSAFSAFSTPASQIHPSGPGVGMGTYENSARGYGAFGHSGGIRAAGSMSMVLPRQKLAIFVNVNAAGTGGFDLRLSKTLNAILNSQDPGFSPDEFVQITLPMKFAARFAGATATANPLRGTDSNCDPSRIPGYYSYVRLQSMNSFAARFFGMLAAPPLPVTRGANGNLQFGDFATMQPISACYFENVKDSYLQGNVFSASGFMNTADGGMFMGPHPLIGLIKVGDWERPQFVLYPFALAVFILAALGCFALIRRKHVSRTTLLAGIGGLVFLMTMLLELEFAVQLGKIDQINWPIILWRLAMNAGLLAILIGGALALRDLARSERLASKAYQAAIALVALIVLAGSVYWQLAGQITA